MTCLPACHPDQTPCETCAAFAFTPAMKQHNVTSEQLHAYACQLVAQCLLFGRRASFSPAVTQRDGTCEQLHARKCATAAA